MSEMVECYCKWTIIHRPWISRSSVYLVQSSHKSQRPSQSVTPSVRRSIVHLYIHMYTHVIRYTVHQGWKRAVFFWPDPVRYVSEILTARPSFSLVLMNVSWCLLDRYPVHEILIRLIIDEHKHESLLSYNHQWRSIFDIADEVMLQRDASYRTRTSATVIVWFSDGKNSFLKRSS